MDPAKFEENLRKLEEENLYLTNNLKYLDNEFEKYELETQTEIERLKSVIEELTKDRLADSEVIELHRTNQELAAQNKRLKQENDNLSKEHLQSATDMNHLREQIEVLELSLQNHRTKEIELQDERDKIQRRLDNLLANQNAPTPQILVEDFSNLDINNASSKRESIISNPEILSIELDETKARQEMLEQVRDELTKELTSANNKIEALELSLETTKETKAAVIEDSYESKLAFEAEINELKQQISMQQSENNSCAKCQMYGESLQELRLQYDNLLLEKEKTEGHLQIAHHKTIQGLEDQISSLKTEVLIQTEQLKSQMEASAVDKQLSENYIQQMRAELLDREGRISDLQSQLAKSNSAIEQLKKSGQDLELQIRDSELMKSALSAQSNALQVELTSVRNDASNIERTNKLFVDVAASQGEIAKLKVELEEKTQLERFLREQLKNETFQSQKLLKEVDNLKMQLLECSRLIDDMNHQANNEQVQVKDKQSSLLNEINELRKVNAELVEELTVSLEEELSMQAALELQTDEYAGAYQRLLICRESLASSQLSLQEVVQELQSRNSITTSTFVSKSQRKDRIATTSTNMLSTVQKSYTTLNDISRKPSRLLITDNMYSNNDLAESARRKAFLNSKNSIGRSNTQTSPLKQQPSMGKLRDSALSATSAVPLNELIDLKTQVLVLKQELWESQNFVGSSPKLNSAMGEEDDKAYLKSIILKLKQTVKDQAVELEDCTRVLIDWLQFSEELFELDLSEKKARPTKNMKQVFDMVKSSNNFMQLKVKGANTTKVPSANVAEDNFGWKAKYEKVAKQNTSMFERINMLEAELMKSPPNKSSKPTQIAQQNSDSSGFSDKTTKSSLNDTAIEKIVQLEKNLKEIKSIFQTAWQNEMSRKAELISLLRKYESMLSANGELVEKASIEIMIDSSSFENMLLQNHIEEQKSALQEAIVIAEQCLPLSVVKSEYVSKSTFEKLSESFAKLEGLKARADELSDKHKRTIDKLEYDLELAKFEIEQLTVELKERTTEVNQNMSKIKDLYTEIVDLKAKRLNSDSKTNLIDSLTENCVYLANAIDQKIENDPGISDVKKGELRALYSDLCDRKTKIDKVQEQLKNEFMKLDLPDNVLRKSLEQLHSSQPALHSIESKVAEVAQTERKTIEEIEKEELKGKIHNYERTINSFKEKFGGLVLYLMEKTSIQAQISLTNSNFLQTGLSMVKQIFEAQERISETKMLTENAKFEKMKHELETKIAELELSMKALKQESELNLEDMSKLKVKNSKQPDPQFEEIGTLKSSMMNLNSAGGKNKSKIVDNMICNISKTKGEVAAIKEAIGLIRIVLDKTKTSILNLLPNEVVPLSAVHLPEGPTRVDELAKSPMHDYDKVVSKLKLKYLKLDAKLKKHTSELQTKQTEIDELQLKLKLSEEACRTHLDLLETQKTTLEQFEPLILALKARNEEYETLKNQKGDIKLENDLVKPSQCIACQNYKVVVAGHVKKQHEIRKTVEKYYKFLDGKDDICVALTSHLQSTEERNKALTIDLQTKDCLINQLETRLKEFDKINDIKSLLADQSSKLALLASTVDEECKKLDIIEARTGKPYSAQQAPMEIGSQLELVQIISKLLEGKSSKESESSGLQILTNLVMEMIHDQKEELKLQLQLLKPNQNNIPGKLQPLVAIDIPSETRFYLNELCKLINETMAKTFQKSLKLTKVDAVVIGAIKAFLNTLSIKYNLQTVQIKRLEKRISSLLYQKQYFSKQLQLKRTYSKPKSKFRSIGYVVIAIHIFLK